MTTPIWQNSNDSSNERKVADKLAELLGWKFYTTPRFHWCDYHVNQTSKGGYENYIGDIEIKWMGIPSTEEVRFPLEKLQKLWMTEPMYDNPEAYNRVCIRYTDGLLLIPAKRLRMIEPQLSLTRADTGEMDFNVHFTAATDFPKNMMGIIVK